MKQSIKLGFGIGFAFFVTACEAGHMSKKDFDLYFDSAAYDSARVSACDGMTGRDGWEDVHASIALRNRVIGAAASLGYDSVRAAELFDRKEKAAAAISGDGKVYVSSLAKLSDAEIVKQIRAEERDCRRLPDELNEMLGRFK